MNNIPRIPAQKTADVNEKSIDGIHFEPIKVITNNLEDYYFKNQDENPDFGNNYYRIKQQFNSSEFHYSSIRKETFYLDDNTITLYPNPAKDELWVNLGRFSKVDGNISIYNMLGQKVNQGGNNGSFCYREEKVVVGGSSSRSTKFIQLATFQRKQEIKLQWVVNSVENTRYFLIERSEDGQQFEPLTLLSDLNTHSSFSWTDENPQTGMNYYRVRQVFQNNQLRYSSIQSEQFFLDEKEFSIFPNPTKDNITLQLKSLKGKEGSILIYNTFGVLVKQIPKMTFEEDYLSINIHSFQNGIYLISLKADQQRMVSKRFVVEYLE